MLLDDRPLIVLPTLAIAIGVNEAIALQQLHWLLCDPNNGKRIAEQQWIFNTVEQWRVSYFPFWSERTIRTVFSNLARRNLIITCQPEGRASRRKYYRVNTEKLPELLEAAKSVTSKRQGSSLGKRQDSSLPITETTTETPAKNSKGALKSTDGLEAYAYPKSEEEMIATLEAHDIEHSADYDGQFFEQMQRAGWRIRGERVFDWMAAYQARLEHITSFKE